MSVQQQIGEIMTRAWDDAELLEKLRNNARATLKEEGIDIPETVHIEVLENNANTLYLVLPG